MDKAQLIAAIVAKHKVRLDEDDPAFLLVDLNQMALEATVAGIFEKKEALLARIESESTRLENLLVQLQQTFLEYGRKINVENAKTISQLKEAAQEDMTAYADKLHGDLIKDIGQLVDEIEESAGLLKTSATETSSSLASASTTLTSATAALSDSTASVKAAGTTVTEASNKIVKLYNQANPSWESKRKDFLWIGAIAGVVGGIVAAVIASVVVVSVVKPTAPANLTSNTAQYQR